MTPSAAAPKYTPAPPPPAHIPPSFVQRMSDVRMVEGTNIKLECRVLGKPFPQVIFTKEGKPVLDGPRCGIYLVWCISYCERVIVLFYIIGLLTFF